MDAGFVQHFPQMLDQWRINRLWSRPAKKFERITGHEGQKFSEAMTARPRWYKSIEVTVEYLRKHALMLTTAESCTGGQIIALIAQVPGSGEVVECGYVVYSPEAKQRLLGGSAKTIANFNLTSVEVAKEMALGALRDSPATVAIATTGLCGEGRRRDSCGYCLLRLGICGGGSDVHLCYQRALFWG